MEPRDHSIIAQVSVKAAAELFAGTGNITATLGAAAEFYHWVVELSQAAQPALAQGGGVAPTPAAPPPDPNFQPAPTACPKCSGPLWDNRATKKGNQPDFKCKDRACGKGIWLTPYQP